MTPLRELAGKEIADRWCITGMHGGAIDDRSGHLRPAKLVRRLRRVTLEMDVEIHEGTAMTALGRTSPPSVCTTKGRLTASRFVLAIYARAA